jgi:hypothetical protein
VAIGQEERSGQRDTAQQASPKTEGKSARRLNKPPVKPAKELMPIQRARRDLGRAMAFADPIRRRTKLRELDTALANLVEQAGSDAALQLEFLALQARVQAELKDFSRARQTIRKLHSLVKERRGPEEFDAWLSDEVSRLRRRHAFELAVAHLSESIKADPESKSSALHSVLIGDILLQKYHPRGPFDRAIRQYAGTAERYSSLHPDIADDARLRQAKALWQSGQPAEALLLFDELSTSANELVRETAEHYAKLADPERARREEGAADAGSASDESEETP